MSAACLLVVWCILAQARQSAASAVAAGFPARALQENRGTTTERTLPHTGSATPSASPRPPHQDDLLLHHLRTFLGIMDAAAIDAVRGRVRWLQLSGGETLMRQGEPGDALYLLVSGRLRVYIEEDGQLRVVREVSRGEVVGEMSLITEAPRSATLVAIRDSVL